MQNVFGDNASGFSFTDNGNLVFTGDTDAFTDEQNDVFSGAFGELMSSEETTSVMYEDSYTAKDGAKIDVLNDYGGGLFHSEDNVIVVSTNAQSIEVTQDSNEAVLANLLTGATTNVKQSTTSILFHEKAEAALGQRVPFRVAVINYENKVRKIIGLPSRPHDTTHSHTIKFIYK